MTMAVITVIVNIAIKSAFDKSHHALTDYPKFCIGMPAVRTDSRSVYGHVIAKFSRMGRFTLLWSSASARVELRYDSNEKHGYIKPES